MSTNFMSSPRPDSPLDLGAYLKKIKSYGNEKKKNQAAPWELP